MLFFKKVTSCRRFSTRLKVPGILSDIDGVVRRGGTKIPGSAEVVKSVLSPINYNGQQFQIPFTLLTNGGGVPESERAMSTNTVLFSKEEID